MMPAKKVNKAKMNKPSQETLPKRWTRWQRDIGVIVWMSFLAASAGTMVVFALLDPVALTEAWAQRWEIGRRLAYSLGFVFLWLLCAGASAMTVFMLRTGPRRGHASGDDGKAVPEIHPPEENNPDLKEKELS